jgi:hypothetical protein
MQRTSRHEVTAPRIPLQRTSSIRRAVTSIRCSRIARAAVRHTSGQPAEEAAYTAVLMADAAHLPSWAVTHTANTAHSAAARAGAEHEPIGAADRCRCGRPDTDPAHVVACGTCHHHGPAVDALDGAPCGRITWWLCIDCWADHAAVCGACGTD